MANTIAVTLVADESDLTRGFETAERAAEKSAGLIDRHMDKIDSALERVGEGSDAVASRGAQAAGALGGLGSLAEEAGGPFKALGGAMLGASTVAQGLADAGDLVNFVTETGIIKNGLMRAQMIATTAATVAGSVASKAWAVTQGALNAVMSANPLALVVIAIVALTAAVVVAYQKSDKFREIVDKAFSKAKDVAEAVAKFFTNKVPAAFDKVKDAASAVLGWVKNNWPTLLAILTGPIGLAVLAITKNWDNIKDGARSVVDFVKDKFEDVLGFFTGLPDRMGAAVSGLWQGIADGFKGAINAVIGWWNGLQLTLDIPDWIPGLPDDVTIGTPQIPYLAKGGIVNRPTLAMIGEAGPEAVIPLNGNWATEGGNTYNLYVTAPVGSQPAEIGRELLRYIEAAELGGVRYRAAG